MRCLTIYTNISIFKSFITLFDIYVSSTFCKRKEKLFNVCYQSKLTVSIWMSWLLDLVQILFKINENVFGSNYVRQWQYISSAHLPQKYFPFSIFFLSVRYSYYGRFKKHTFDNRLTWKQLINETIRVKLCVISRIFLFSESFYWLICVIPLVYYVHAKVINEWIQV